MTHPLKTRAAGIRASVCTLVAIVMAVASSGTAFGQGFLLPDDRMIMPEPVRQSYKLDEFSIDVQITDQIAQTQVSQVFRNTGTTQMEVSFVFPLPYDGAVDRMTFLVDDEEWEAKLLPADEAREIYEGYVRRYEDPALLEWSGTGIFKTSVFPVPAGSTRTVTLNYAQLLKKNDRATDYTFPLSTARFSAVPVDRISFRASIHSDHNIKNIYSPSHEIEISRDDDRNAVVEFSAEEKIPASDFRLIYDTDDETIGASVLSYWPEGADEGFFILMASPEVKKESDEDVAKSVILVIDRSGSMNGKKIDQARDAAKFVLNNLNEGDLFNIVGYDTRVEPFRPEMERFNEESRSEAIAYINGTSAGGGTNIDGALQTALSNVQDAETPTYVCFLTDGRPTVGEQNDIRIVETVTRLNPHGARIISFGVGFDVNSRLLDRLTATQRGQSHYVSPSDDIEVAVSRLYDSISSPILTDIQIAYDFDAMDVDDDSIVTSVYPSQAIDIFAGNQLVIVGRYSESGTADVELKGRVGTEDNSFNFQVEFAAEGENAGNGFVEKLWAVRRVGDIIDQIDLRGHDDALVEELVALATQHGIVTRYTSFLADENASAEEELGDIASNRAVVGSNLLALEAVEGQSAWMQRNTKQELRNLGAGGGFGGGGGGMIGSAPVVGDFAADAYFGRAGTVVEASAVDSALAGIRSTANSCVYKRGNEIIAWNAAERGERENAVNVARFSDEYFELIASNSREENELIASQQAGEKLFIKLRGNMYCIE
ncbi:MAG: VIT domain-containing protein [Planctomycetota bacterium]